MPIDIFAPLEIYAFLVFYLWVLWAGTSTLIGIALGLRVREIAIFSGPVRRTYQWRGITVLRRTLPLGCSVRFLSRHDPEPAEGARRFEDLSPAAGVVLALSGCLALLLLSLVTIGPAQTLHHVTGAYAEVWHGALAPRQVGVPLLERFYAVHDQSVPIALGVLSAKLLAVNLVPYLGSPGYMAIAFVRGAHFQPDTTPRQQLFAWLLLIPALLVTAGWALAMGFYVFAPYA